MFMFMFFNLAPFELTRHRRLLPSAAGFHDEARRQLGGSDDDYEDPYATLKGDLFGVSLELPAGPSLLAPPDDARAAVAQVFVLSKNPVPRRVGLG